MDKPFATTLDTGSSRANHTGPWRTERPGWQVPVDAAPTGQRVLVAGAGPSGLSATYHLTRLADAVTIKNRTPRPAA